MKKMDRMIQPPLVNFCSLFNLYSISSTLFFFLFIIFLFFNDGMYLLGGVLCFLGLELFANL